MAQNISIQAILKFKYSVTKKVNI